MKSALDRPLVHKNRNLPTAEKKSCDRNFDATILIIRKCFKKASRNSYIFFSLKRHSMNSKTIFGMYRKY
jgi:hypothetical protein